MAVARIALIRVAFFMGLLRVEDFISKWTAPCDTPFAALVFIFCHKPVPAVAH